MARSVLSPREAGLALQEGSFQVLEKVGLPRDPRGIVLLCGYLAATAFGVTAVLTPPGDPIGWAYLLLAGVGYFFIQARGITIFLWVLVAGAGLAVALAGTNSGWVEFALGLAVAAVGAVPPPTTRATPAGATALNGNSSSFLEVSTNHGHAPINEKPIDPAESSARLEIRSMGRLQLLCGELDLASSLEDKPVLAFLFKYLLARSVAGEPQALRSAVAEELSPGLPDSNQRERLRKQLYDMQRDTNPDVGSLVLANRSHVWFALDKADSDAGRLAALSAAVRKRASLISAEEADEIRHTLEDSDQEFVSGFEELEQKVNQGRGTASDVVARARNLIADQRVELISALAEYQDAIGRPEAAIGHLRAGLDAMPERQDLARLLVVAYLKTGQTARAGEVRRQFALKQE